MVFTMPAANIGILTGAPLKPGDAHQISKVPLRGRPDGEFYFQENEFADIYSPLVGPFAAAIFTALCRNSYGRTDIEYSVRDLARATGMSPTTAARAIQSLQTIGLIRLSPRSGNRRSVCQLLDVKALAELHGAKRKRKGAPLALPQSTSDKLKADLKALRRNQQGKLNAPALLSGNQDVEIAARTGFHSLLSVSQRDATVSHLIRQRFTRETQTGSLLLQEERRIEEVLSPTPFQNEAARKAKAFPDEEKPVELVRWAEIKFTGVIKDLKSHLLDTSRPPSPNLTNGFADWQMFGFDSLAVEAAEWRGKTLSLALSVSDPAAARRGLQKYRQRWETSLRKWYECEVEWEVCAAKPKW